MPRYTNTHHGQAHATVGEHGVAQQLGRAAHRDALAVVQLVQPALQRWVRRRDGRHDVTRHRARGEPGQSVSPSVRQSGSQSLSHPGGAARPAQTRRASAGRPLTAATVHSSFIWRLNIPTTKRRAALLCTASSALFGAFLLRAPLLFCTGKCRFSPSSSTLPHPHAHLPPQVALPELAVRRSAGHGAEQKAVDLNHLLHRLGGCDQQRRDGGKRGTWGER